MADQSPGFNELILYSSTGLTLTLLSLVFMRNIDRRHLKYNDNIFSKHDVETL